MDTWVWIGLIVYVSVSLVVMGNVARDRYKDFPDEPVNSFICGIYIGFLWSGLAVVGVFVFLVWLIQLSLTWVLKRTLYRGL